MVWFAQTIRALHNATRLSSSTDYLYSPEEVAELIQQSSWKNVPAWAKAHGLAAPTVYDWQSKGIPKKGMKSANLAKIEAAFRERDSGPAPLIQVDRQADRFREDIYAIMRDLTAGQLLELKSLARSMQLKSLAAEHADELKDVLNLPTDNFGEGYIENIEGVILDDTKVDEGAA